MKNFLALLKILIKNDFKKDKSKKSFKINNAILAEIIIAGIMVIAVIALSLTAGVYLNDLGLGAEYLGLLFLVSQLMVLIFGTVLLLSVMYFAKDVSFLLPLPIKMSTVFWAKFIYVYIHELFFAGLMVLAGGLTFLIAVNASAFSYLILVLAVLLIPCLPLMLSSILTLPIIYLSGYLKSKGPVLAIVLTLVFSAIMFFYMYFINSMQVLSDGENFLLPQETQTLMKNFFNIFIPVGSLTKLILLKNTLVNLGLFAASHAGLIVLILLLSQLTFKKSMQKQLEESKGKASTEFKYSKTTVVKSIIKKDFKEIIRNPGLAFNCLVSVVMGPIFIVVFGLTYNSGVYSEEIALKITSFAVGFMFLTLFPAALNMTALSSVTREGQNFYHLKTLPIKYDDQLNGKIILAKIFSFAAILTSGATFLIFSKIDIFISLGTTIFALLFVDGYTYYLVLLDLKYPKLNYKSVTAALKNSKSSILAFLLAFGLLLPLLIALIFIIVFLYDSMPIMLLWTIIFIPAFTYAIILNFVFRKKIKNNGINILKNIEP